MNSSSTYTLRKELRAKKINPGGQEQHGRPGGGRHSPGEAFDGVSGSRQYVGAVRTSSPWPRPLPTLSRAISSPRFSRAGASWTASNSRPTNRRRGKWPSRTEQLSLLLGQICSVGGRLNSQLLAAGGALASQIAEKAKGGEEAPAADSAAAAEAAAAPRRKRQRQRRKLPPRDNHEERPGLSNRLAALFRWPSRVVFEIFVQKANQSFLISD